MSYRSRAVRRVRTGAMLLLRGCVFGKQRHAATISALSAEPTPHEHNHALTPPASPAPPQLKHQSSSRVCCTGAPFSADHPTHGHHRCPGAPHHLPDNDSRHKRATDNSHHSSIMHRHHSQHIELTATQLSTQSRQTAQQPEPREKYRIDRPAIHDTTHRPPSTFAAYKAAPDMITDSNEPQASNRQLLSILIGQPEPSKRRVRTAT